MPRQRIDRTRLLGGGFGQGVLEGRRPVQLGPRHDGPSSSYRPPAQMSVKGAPQLFECFLPGDDQDPADSCIGAFYDTCSGSE